MRAVARRSLNSLLAPGTLSVPRADTVAASSVVTRTNTARCLAIL
jgi:hypothetical protein